MTDGAAALAKRFNISSLVIGLTIVAFGTSAPELTVSIVSAINGSAELSIGNVVGSNIFNILMIVGVTAVVAPITITKGTLTKEIPLAILSCVVVLICANDVFLETGTENILNRADGLLMLCFLPYFSGIRLLSHTIIQKKNKLKLNRYLHGVVYCISLEGLSL